MPQGCQYSFVHGLFSDLANVSIGDPSEREQELIDAARNVDGIDSVLHALVLGTKDYLRKCGFERAIVGLSGGVDSAVTLAIAARALGPDNVRVNCITPGVIKTPRLAFSGTEIPEFAVRSQKMTPLQRLGTAEEVAELVLFLASDRSSYITGQDIAIDGGLAVAPLFETMDLP